MSRVHSAFDEEGHAIDTAYNDRVGKFLDEYEWYTAALKCQREGAAGDDHIPMQQELCQES